MIGEHIMSKRPFDHTLIGKIYDQLKAVMEREGCSIEKAGDIILQENEKKRRAMMRAKADADAALVDSQDHPLWAGTLTAVEDIQKSVDKAELLVDQLGLALPSEPDPELKLLRVGKGGAA